MGKFRDKTGSAAKNEKATGSQYGHLKMPEGLRLYQPTPGGRTEADFLPYIVNIEDHPDRDDENAIAVPGTQWYRRPFFIHRGIGGTHKGGESVVCPSSINLPCPICEYISARKREGAPRDELRAIRLSKRNLYIVIPYGEKKVDEDIHLFDISSFCFQKLLNDELDEKEEFRDFPDLHDGMLVKIRWDSQKIEDGDPFAKASRIDFEPRPKGEGFDDSILEEVPNLDDIIRVSTLSYEKLNALFLEIDDATERAERATAAPEASRRASRGRRRQTPANDTPETAEQKGETKEETKETSTPARGRRRRTAAAPPTDEPADEPADDDDIVCVACGGSGEASNGAVCKPCGGSGEKQAETKQTTTQRRQRSTSTAKGECPHGHRFGTDVDKQSECPDCDKWDDCIDAKDA